MTTLLHRSLALTFLAVFAMAIGCQTTPDTAAKRTALDDESTKALARLKAEDPGIQGLIDRGYGYVIFPDAGKGGFIVGGAYGRGTVYEQGNMIGYADISQASIGAQVGGQSFSELIVFENKEALEKFKNNQFSMTAQASAVIIKSGAAASAKFENGVAVLIKPTGGAMVDASVGGQKFTYKPMDTAMEAKHEMKE